MERDRVFVALTRPQMFAGVTYGFFIVNLILATELFLLFKSAWVLALALAIHLFGVGVSTREPRLFDLWATRARKCPRVKNYAHWQCNSYRP